MKKCANEGVVQSCIASVSVDLGVGERRLERSLSGLESLHLLDEHSLVGVLLSLTGDWQQLDAEVDVVVVVDLEEPSERVVRIGRAAALHHRLEVVLDELLVQTVAASGLQTRRVEHVDASLEAGDVGHAAMLASLARAVAAVLHRQLIRINVLQKELGRVARNDLNLHEEKRGREARGEIESEKNNRSQNEKRCAELPVCACCFVLATW